MNRERWEQLKPLFHGALEQPSSRRADWLRQACPDDNALRDEAQALVDAHETAGGFLESSIAFDDATEEAALETGRAVGPYVVRGELGRGGMGIVYLAEDVRLGRSVALKALPASLAGDPQRRERLRREARAAAALTHPGIAVVYALEEIDGHLFIAAEHVRGRTLKAELSEGPLGWQRALDTAIEIVRALCAAHEAGIVHRDLKPENILRTEEGGIKVLDFGIAQFTDRTLTQLTLAGTVLGTPAYMAPEQFLGGEVDFRADLYAAGVLLVEMVTGAHPFATDSIQRPSTDGHPSTGLGVTLSGSKGQGAVSNVGRREPMPDALKSIGDRCLARDPRQRYASTRDLLSDLESVRDSLPRRSAPEAREGGPAAAFTPRWWWEFHQAVAALVYGLLAIPVWNARGLIGGFEGRGIFMVTLVAIIVSANLRLHRWFTSRFYPAELSWVRARTSRWVTVADWVFSASLATAGLLVVDARAALAILLISFGVGTAVVFLFVEPVTERAAFRD